MTTTASSRSGISLLRRIIVGVIIASFGIAAILGIIVLLGFDVGETTGKVLGTTAVIGCFSVAVLCCATLIGRPVQLIGIVGVIVAVLTAGYIVWFIWASPTDADWDLLFRLLWTGVAASAAFSLASLLLLLADRRRTAVRVGLWITIALLVILFALTMYLTWSHDAPWDDFMRLYGIVAILAALGAVVVPVMSLLLPDAEGDVRLPAPLAARLVATAAHRGITVEELVAPVLDAADVRPDASESA